MYQNATRYQSNTVLRYLIKSVTKPNITSQLNTLTSIVRKNILTTQPNTNMITKQFVRKLKFLIVRPITKKLALTNKSSIVKHPTKLRQVMKTKNNVPPITRNIVSLAITTERNVTKFPKRSATMWRYQSTTKYHKNTVATIRSLSATKYQNSIAQKHTSKNATKFQLKFLTKNPTEVVIGLRSHIMQMTTIVSSFLWWKIQDRFIYLLNKTAHRKTYQHYFEIFIKSQKIIKLLT